MKPASRWATVQDHTLGHSERMHHCPSVSCSHYYKICPNGKAPAPRARPSPSYHVARP